MHAILLTADAGLGIEHVDELGEVLEMLRHLRGEDHVNHVVPDCLVRVAVEILKYVHAVVIWNVDSFFYTLLSYFSNFGCDQFRLVPFVQCRAE